MTEVHSLLSKNVCKKGRVAILISSCAVLAVVGVVMLGFLAYGNSQSCRWIYLFQTKVRPRKDLRYDLGKPHGFRIRPPTGYTGIWHHWSNPEWHVKFSYVDGKLNGDTEGFLGSKMIFQYRYENGLKEGIGTSWILNGQKKAETSWKQGELHGVCRSWTDAGVLWRETNNKNGLRHGQQIEYTNDGRSVDIYNEGLLVRSETWRDDKLLEMEHFSSAGNPSAEPTSGGDSSTRADADLKTPQK